MQFVKVVVVEKIMETAQAATLVLSPNESTEIIKFKAGQYLTVNARINGEMVRRPYSMSSAPFEDHLAITVKLVKGGLMSNYLVNQVKIGDVLEVAGPEGQFMIQPGLDRRTAYFIAAGSGITPVFSMIQTLLEEEPTSQVVLLYGNRTVDDIIFAARLKDLKTRYAGQVEILYALSSPKVIRQKGFRGFFKKPIIDWDGWVGRVSKPHVERMIAEYPDLNNNAQFFLCGPGDMIDNVKRWLEDLNIQGEVSAEYFSSSSKDKDEVASKVYLNTAAHAEVMLDGLEVQVLVQPQETILDALVKEGFDPPYSCRSGACSTCVAKLLSGTVDMPITHGLTDEEKEEGIILTCQAHPTSGNVKVEYI